VNNTTAASGAGIFACRSRGTLAAPTIVQDNDNLATISFAGGDGVDLALAARISVEVDGTPGSNDMPGRMVFLTTPDGSQTPVEAMRINNAQNVTVTAGNLVIGTSGKGIDFSATPGAGTSELLSDYEEGTWTPVWTGGSTAGTYTYSIQQGRYTKIGNQVTVWFALWDITASVAGTGDGTITGLPFTCANVSGIRATFAPNLKQGATTRSNLIGFVPTNTATIFFVADNNVSGNGTAIPVTDADGNFDAVGCLTYFV
jgi:hypothetical protein